MKKFKKGYLAVGNDRAVISDRIIGIFDLDTTSVKKDTRVFLNLAQKTGRIETTGTDLPLSFLILNEQVKPKDRINKNSRKKPDDKIILSPVSVQTLLSRAAKI